MTTIREIQIVEQRQLEQRRRKRCDDCGRLRLTTRCIGRWVITGAPVELYICNECLSQPKAS